VSVTPFRQFVYVFVSAPSPTLWHRAVPKHIVLFFIVRGHSPSPAPVRFICTIACVTPPGIFQRLLDPRSGTIARTVPSLGILEIIGRYKYRYNIRQPVVIPRQGIGVRHRYPCTCTTTLVLLSVRQLHSNHYPYSEPAIRKVILYCLEHHHGVV
jgi:hypothetical protein